MSTVSDHDANEIAIFKWYLAHKNHVHSLVAGETNSYAPTGSDAIRPELWKAAHWRHYLGLNAARTASTEGGKEGKP